MSVPQTPNINYHPYSHTLQIRLYQAFIFSIPILFSIILFLLFYLFYLKRRAYALSSVPPTLPTSTLNYNTSFLHMPHAMGLKGGLKDKLPKVVFDEHLKAKDSVCCVCLGEFELKEELIQVPSCKHVFHKECLHHWLQSNSTCPLCRCCVFLAVGPLSLPLGPPPIHPNIHINGDGPPTQGITSTTTTHENTSTTTTADNTSSTNTSVCLRVPSTSNDTRKVASSGVSDVIHDQPQ
ncbi:probable E3 ubiquitin-protein ligase RHA4A [Rutidosis leptorrhynchoides]|uniref:probable E3 ubiquitin-protein ligase RHA4A n=1 Tax=Rutidosis leptorrhynchoides TaxID=125765 RepID=UPI003A99DFC2